MLGGRLLPCSTCGAWAGSGSLCASCGTARTRELVPLDACPGDDRWIHVRRGDPDSVLAALDAIRPVGTDTQDALARLGAARRLVRKLASPGAEVALWLDLRRSESGHPARRRRRGSKVETFYLLPWLVLRASRIEVRLLRYAHRKVTRTFAGSGVATDSVDYDLDELRVSTPQGALRRPIRRLASLQDVDLHATQPNVPGVGDQLPATAPGLPWTRGAPLAAGAVAALFLLMGVPLALGLLLPDPSPAPTDYGPLKAAVDADPPSPTVVRAALAREDLRREGLAGTHVLGSRERWRALRAAAWQPEEAVWSVALTLLEREGDLGIATLADLYRGSGDPAVRHAALLALENTDPELVLALAIGGLARGPREPPDLRRKWIQIVGNHAQGVPSQELWGTLERTAQDPDLDIRLQASWTLFQLDAGRSKPALRRAFGRTLQDAERGFDPDVTRALIALGRCLSRLGDHATLRSALRDPNLPGRARLVFERLLNDGH